MKKIIRFFRNFPLINIIIASFLQFSKNATEKIILYWPITGSKSYLIANTPLILNSNGDDGFVNRVFYKKGFDEKVLEVFKTLISNGTNVIYDIGANIGVFTLLAGKTNNNNFIYSFEPNPLNFKRLQSNIRLNKIKNVKIFEIAVGNENKTLQLTRPKGNYISDVTSVYGSHTKKFTDFEHEQFEAKQIRLDTLIEEDKIKLPDFIKIDVELFEYEVLIGAKKIIYESHPIVLCELHNYEIITGINSNLAKELPFNFTKKIAIFFKELNYTAYAIGEYGLLRVNHFDEMINVKNYLFLPHQPANKFYSFNEVKEMVKR